MANVIACPECQQSLTVPESVAGKKVKCPRCAHQFVAPGPAAPSPLAPPPEDDNPWAVNDEPEERPDRRRRRRTDADDDDAGTGGEPHRGGTVMVLGILSIVLGFPIGLVLGIIAFNMANADLLQMAAGGMDRSGRGQTQTGKTCALVGIFLNVIGLVSCCGCVGLQIALEGLR